MLKSHHGFALLESLITIIILAFGLLAVAGLQIKLHTAEMEAYQRSQAIILLEDMVSKISANRTNVDDYVDAGSEIGTGDAQPASCAGTAIGVDRDICDWSNALKGAAEKSSASDNLGAMIGARGCIESVSTDPTTVRVVVAWQGLGNTAAPSLTCGSGSYGNEKLRRVISETVTIGKLI